MNLHLDNKIIIVTGGAKGIGLGICKVLASEGAIPVIIGRKESDNQIAIKEIEAAGGIAKSVVAELTKPEDCENAIKQIVTEFGRIDGPWNNAGVNDGVGLESGNYDAFIDFLHKNLVHYYLMAHHALSELKKSKGSIVNIGSKTAEPEQGSTSCLCGF